MIAKNYQPGDVIDLDDVLISPAAYQVWHAVARAAALSGILSGIRPDRIPIEQCLWLPSGELEIFVDVPNVGRVSMKIPPDQWAWKQ
ncbi:MAG TPA: hypothetical protein VNM40_02595 [Candidatus Paceibacterota bacterium]|nr:hypothetical protein [Candidatus Paceibacterota bacterium]